MPKPLDLSISGLRRSKRIAELKRKGMTPAYAPPSRKSILVCLTVFGLFSSVATTITSVASTQAQNVTQACTSMLTQATDSYHRANTLFDETIHCFSTAALSTAATNDVFTFKEAMQQKDKTEFVKTMMKEIYSHEEEEHRTTIERNKIPPDTKQ